MASFTYLKVTVQALLVALRLHHFFCLSLTKHYIPLEWHTHLVKLFFKSGDKHCIRNCRPISLLYIILKNLREN